MIIFQHENSTGADSNPIFWKQYERNIKNYIEQISLYFFKLIVTEFAAIMTALLRIQTYVQ